MKRLLQGNDAAATNEECCQQLSEKITRIEDDHFSVSNLPNEILAKIFTSTSKLTLRDLYLSCSLVCKRWNSIITSADFLLNLINAEFDEPAAKLFSIQPNAAQIFQQILRSSDLFSPRAQLLDGRSSTSHELQLNAIRITSVEHFVGVMKSQPEMESSKWRSLSHVYVNGGFCNHYWYWLVNFQVLLAQLPELVSVLSFPFAIGASSLRVSSSSPLHLLDVNLDLIDEPIEQQKDSETSSACWIMSNYSPGLCYVAFEVYDDFSGNEDMPVRLLWPSQIERFEQRLFIAEMNQRYGAATSSCIFVGGDSQRDSEYSLDDTEEEDDDGFGNSRKTGKSSNRDNINEFWRCFDRQSSSESSAGESDIVAADNY